jgi:hypothetical protein
LERLAEIVERGLDDLPGLRVRLAEFGELLDDLAGWACPWAGRRCPW